MVPRPVLSPIVYVLTGLAVGIGLGLVLPQPWAGLTAALLALAALIIAVLDVRRNF